MSPPISSYAAWVARYGATYQGKFMGVAPRFAFEVELDASGAAVVKDSTGAQRANWRTAGFPSTLHFLVEQINPVRRPGGVRATEMVLRSGVIAGRVFVPNGQEAAFRKVVAPEPHSRCSLSASSLREAHSFPGFGIRPGE